MLFSFTTNRQFIVKGRNVGKTTLLDAMKSKSNVPFSSGSFTQSTFAMKSNPNPYRVPAHKVLTGPTASVANKRSALDIVIRKEIIPGCVDDVLGADAFDNWVFEGFRNGVSQTLGSIRARYVPTNTFHRNTFVVKREDIDTALHSQANSGHLDYLIKVIDAQIMEAVRNIVSRALPPHDINNCKDPECMC